MQSNSKAYIYHAETGAYLGETDCQKNPLEDGFLIPANATIQKPLLDPFSLPFWDFENKAWIYKKEKTAYSVSNPIGKLKIDLEDWESWNPCPNPEKLHFYTIEKNKWIFNTKAETEAKKNLILSQLQSIDLKSIRALREGNETRIQELELEAETLRNELRNL